MRVEHLRGDRLKEGGERNGETIAGKGGTPPGPAPSRSNTPTYLCQPCWPCRRPLQGRRGRRGRQRARRRLWRQTWFVLGWWWFLCLGGGAGWCEHGRAKCGPRNAGGRQTHAAALDCVVCVVWALILDKGMQERDRTEHTRRRGLCDEGIDLTRGLDCIVLACVALGLCPSQCRCMVWPWSF